MKKNKLDLLAVSDYAMISQEGKLSLIGIFDQIFVPNLPAQHPQIYIVGVVESASGKTEDITLEIKNPSGSDAIPAQHLSVTAGINAKSNIVATINNLPINEVGIYKIKLSDRQGVLGEKEFGVFKASKQEMTTKPSSKYTN